MNLRRSLISAVLFALTSPCLQPVSAGEMVKRTPLDDYVAKPDSTYSWKVIKKIRGDGFTTFVLDLKSQSWRKPPEVDRSVWQHWVVVVKPDVVKYDTAFLQIGGGANDGKVPEKPDVISSLVAKNTNSVVASLHMIPNQPLVFNGDGTPRKEDDLIAYCQGKYLDTGDPIWLARLPMVKSAVRAMDAVTELMASDEGGKTPVKKWVVAGGSKRGWTTWLTAVVDPRVVAIIPVVIDVVNVPACSANHYGSYGFWTEAVGDYLHHKIMERADSPQYAELLKIIDPYSYIDRLTLPKFVLNAAGDQYFPPDSSKFYYHDLKGVKYLRYVPNTKHNLQNSDAVQSILAFYLAILKGSHLPQYSWAVQPDGSIRIETKDKPREVNLWQANNPEARDFRLDKIGPAYKKATLEDQGGGVYIARVPTPEKGWTAFFAELVFDSGEKVPHKFTTQVHILPDRLPHNIDEFRQKLKAPAQ
jgi:PhoPQ-activated pathogenicity-related protein